MSIFCYKKIDAAVRLGEQFCKKREELKLTLEEAAEKTRVPLKYLAALEKSRFSDLPKTKVHRLAYVKEYATYLNLSPQVCVGQFSCEDGLEGSHFIHPLRAIKLFPFSSISTALRTTILASLVIFFASYLVWQVRRVLEPPRLAVYAPIEGHVLNQTRTAIVGETEKETHLTINGQDVMVTEDGKFDATIDLTVGVNTITIEAVKKHGKTTTLTRHVVVKQTAGIDEVSLR